MNKSRIESAVQELPPRSGRARSEASSMRALDKLLLGGERAEPASKPESPVGEKSAGDPAVVNNVGDDDEVLFDDVVIDEAELHDAAGFHGEAPFHEAAEFHDAAELHGAGALDGAGTGGDIRYGTPSEFDPGEPDVITGEGGESNHQTDQPGSVPFTDALLEKLIADVRGPLAAALADAERVLVEPDRVAVWFENQARRRLLSLVGKFSDELQGTEVKRVLTSPPGSSKDS